MATKCLIFLLIAAQSAFSFIQPVVHIRSKPRWNLHSRGAISMQRQLERVDYSVDVPYKEAAYDPAAADVFFRARPLTAMGRLGQLVVKSSGFITSVILDKKLGREERMVEQRSQELLELVTSLGPTSIKVGQALSTRTDLLPAAYAAGLTGLQDAVPPFSGELGRAVIEQELGIKLDEVFSELSLEPVASASIGQVYRGRLRETGEEVAVKVQRPKVLVNVALDLFMMRSIAPLWQKVQDINTDLVGLVDAWGTGFVNELDYRKEAEATTAFSAAMRDRGLGSVVAPEVVEHLSSVHVLTTKWVDGERLASSQAADVPRLCGVALNAYLTMLLDTGTLHCDPHPGNLLRTRDGKLCILDWGMVIQVPQDLQLALLEFIANLSAENYEQVPNDLVQLGFVPADKIEELRASGLTVAIASTLRLAASGGGPTGAMKRLVEENKQKYAAELAEFDDLDSPEATKRRQELFRADWQRQMAQDAAARGGGEEAGRSTTADVTAKIEELQEQNADVFAIPDYFVYMSRAFSTLEGIGLSSDPEYAILKECFPYLAKRLLSDDSPRARGALRTLLYGTGDSLNVEKLQEMTAGLESYTASTASVESSRGVSDEGRRVAGEELAAAVLAEDPTLLQELLLREAALALDLSARDLLAQSPPAAILRSLPPVGLLPAPVAPLLAPLTLPLELARASVQLDDDDQRRLPAARLLGRLASNAGREALAPGRRSGGGGGVADVAKAVQAVQARQRALGRIGVRFGGALAGVQAERLRRDAGGAGAGAGEHREDELSGLARQLAGAGAEGLEGVAALLAGLDDRLAAQSAPPQLPPSEASGSPRARR